MKLMRYLIAISLNPFLIFKSIYRLPWFFFQKVQFQKLLKKNSYSHLEVLPILFDYDKQVGLLGEYFWQDLLVAKKIIKLNPKRHIDIGSRIDGFIAHLACVRKIEVLDIRPLSSSIENVKFTQWDINNPKEELYSTADCVSCLHTLEHLGLGRYGDKLDPDGWKKGLNSIVNLLVDKGKLWLSVPLGNERIMFNVHRIFAPKTIVDYCSQLGIKLAQFYYLTDNGFKKSSNILKDMRKIANKNYTVGIFLFRKQILA